MNRYTVMSYYIAYGGPWSGVNEKMVPILKNKSMKEVIKFLGKKGIDYFEIGELLKTEEDCMGCFNFYRIDKE